MIQRTFHGLAVPDRTTHPSDSAVLPAEKVRCPRTRDLKSLATIVRRSGRWRRKGLDEPGIMSPWRQSYALRVGRTPIPLGIGHFDAIEASNNSTLIAVVRPRGLPMNRASIRPAAR